MSRIYDKNFEKVCALEFTGRVLTHAEACQALADFEEALAPANQSQILKAVTRCYALTAAPAQSVDDLALTISALVEELLHYPGCAVLAALSVWPKKNRWRPTLADLVRLIEEELSGTVLLRVRLEAWADGKP